MNDKPTKRLYIKTYGCQMNIYDSERMADLLRPLGYGPTDRAHNADLVILNTCHIREKATEKVYSELGRIKSMKVQSGGRMTIAVAGCVAQAEGEEIMRRQPAVDLVLGPQAYHKLPEMVARASRAVGDRLETNFDTQEKFDALPKVRKPNGPTAFVSIQEGCDKFCTFCVVPYTRGAELSRSVDDIVLEARSLIKQGVREITLLGQNVNAYHGAAPTIAPGPEWTLAQLLRHLSKIGGLDRIRFITSHPRDMEDDLILAHGDTPALMPFFHLPVQSGSNTILKAMNRGHTREDYFEIIKKMRAQRPDIAISSDFIVGFPGESEKDFQDTLDLIDSVKFAVAYSYTYSQRPGTPATEMFGQVDEAVKHDRLLRLQDLLKEQQTQFNADCIGRTLPVLVSGTGKRDGQLHGRTPYLQSIHFQGPASLMNQIIDVQVTGATMSSLTGELAGEQARSGAIA